VNVILDFGFWAKVEREDYRARAKQLGAGSEIHFLVVPEADLMERLALRNARPSQGAFTIPEAMLKAAMAIFHPAPRIPPSFSERKYSLFPQISKFLRTWRSLLPRYDDPSPNWGMAMLPIWGM